MQQKKKSVIVLSVGLRAKMYSLKVHKRASTPTAVATVATTIVATTTVAAAAATAITAAAAAVAAAVL